MPKYVMSFSKDNKTQVRFFYCSAENIRAMIDDKVFSDSLAETYEKIISMVDEAISL